MISFLLGMTVVAIAKNTGTQRNPETIYNDVWNPSTNTLSIQGV